MQPLQVWLPTITQSLAGDGALADMQRAFQRGQGVDTLWLLPELTTEEPWREVQDDRTIYGCLAIPATRLERLDVYYIDPQGAVCGRNVAKRFPPGTPQEWLATWLHCGQEGIDHLTTIESSIMRPCFAGGQVVYVEQRLDDAAYCVLPLETWDKTTTVATFTWPPPGAPFSVSPEVESRVPGLRRIEIGGVPFVGPLPSPHVVSTPLVKDGVTIGMVPPGFIPPVSSMLPSPLNKLCPFGASLDVLYHIARMRAVAQCSATSQDTALQEALNVVGAYTSQGTVQNGGTITRCWGAIGLFWTLLLDQLKDGLPYRECQACHSLNPGKAGKQYCSQSDNPPCFHRRRAADKRRERHTKSR